MDFLLRKVHARKEYTALLSLGLKMDILNNECLRQLIVLYKKNVQISGALDLRCLQVQMRALYQVRKVVAY
jgi:hypothetical protein